MSDFLLVVPPDWTEIENDGWIDSVVPASELTFMINQEAWGDIDNALASMVKLPAGKNVAGARLINTDAGYRFWVKFVP